MSHNSIIVNAQTPTGADLSVSLSSTIQHPPAPNDFIVWGGSRWLAAPTQSGAPKYSREIAISMAPNSINYAGAGYAYPTGTDIEFRTASSTLLPASPAVYPSGTWASLVQIPAGTYLLRFMPWTQDAQTADATLQIYSYDNTSRTGATPHGNKMQMRNSWRQSQIAVARVTFAAARYVGLRVIAGTARLGNLNHHSLLEYSAIKEI